MLSCSAKHGAEHPNDRCQSYWIRFTTRRWARPHKIRESKRDCKHKSLNLSADYFCQAFNSVAVKYRNSVVRRSFAKICSFVFWNVDKTWEIMNAVVRERLPNTTRDIEAEQCLNATRTAASKWNIKYDYIFCREAILHSQTSESNLLSVHICICIK